MRIKWDGNQSLFLGHYCLLSVRYFAVLSQSMIGLIAARAIQGMGAGAMMPVALTIIGDLYSIEKRAKVLGLNSSAWGIASVFGPLAGGFIVETISWHWIFFINVPIGILLIIFIWLYLNEPKIIHESKQWIFLVV